MELYLDSVDRKEIDEAFALGFLTGLTTTPTFMHREGVKDVDGLILELATKVPILQVEALGDDAEQIYAEAQRLTDIGLSKETTVYKIPVSLEGVKATKMLSDAGFMVNVHLVYTLQQAYMAMASGATYVCPLVGRLQDQGHDALALIEQCVEAVNYYGYDSKIMFSSVRHAEHVRNAINLGVHAVTVPWKVMKSLTENNFTTLGTKQFVEHTKMATMTASNLLRGYNPTVLTTGSVVEALVQMTESGLGAVSIVNGEGVLQGIFTDGDLRRGLKERGNALLESKMEAFIGTEQPKSVDADQSLMEVSDIFKKTKVDNLIVTSGGKPIGILDIQDLVKLGE